MKIPNVFILLHHRWNTWFKTGHFFFHAKRNDRMSHIWYKDIAKTSKTATEVSFPYSKSVSCENFKCVDFASVQVKHIVENRPFLVLIPNRIKNESYLTQCHMPNWFSFIQSQWPIKIPNVLILHQYRWNTKFKLCHFSLMPNWMKRSLIFDTMA